MYPKRGEKMTYIYLTTNDQQLFESSKPTVASGNQNTVILHVDFDEPWDGYAKSAVFFTEKSPVYEVVLSDDECAVPREVLKKDGMIYIGVRGVSSSTSEVKSSAVLKYRIVKGAPEGDGTTVLPTPTVYQQLITALNVERSRLNQLAKLTDGSTTGDAELIDGRVSSAGYIHDNIGDHIRDVAEQAENNLKSVMIDGYDSTDNFVDVKEGCTKVEGHFFRSPDSDMVSSDAWNCYTLAVRPGEKFRIKTYTVSAGAAVAFMAMEYNADEIDPVIWYYPEAASSGEIVDIEVIVPAGAVQMLVNENVNNYSATIEKRTGQRFIKSTASGILSGKILVCCGDSITEAVNPDGGYFTNYAECAANRHGMTCIKDGVGGSTMAYGQGKSFAIDRYLSIPEFDYLTIWFGWNDAEYSALGTIDDTDNNTFYGAYKVVLDHLIANNPTKKIGLIVPYGDNEVEPFAQAVRDISALYGVPCLDLRDHNKCSLIWGTENNAQTARRSALTYDGTHPNQAGHEFISTMYEQFILSL